MMQTGQHAVVAFSEVLLFTAVVYTVQIYNTVLTAHPKPCLL